MYRYIELTLFIIKFYPKESSINEDWLVDGRKIPDEVMGYIRKIAVQAIRENGQSPEVVAKVLNFNRSCIYEWLKRYDRGGI